MYFQNRYISSPALAGLESGWFASAAYKVQWTMIEGAPHMGYFTTEYGSPNKKVGAGIHFYNEYAGLIRRTSLKASYAYHLPLSEQNDQFLDFGLALGMLDEGLNMDKVKGNLEDISLYNFNERKLYFDGDFGIGYRNQNLSLQASMPNLKRLFHRDLLRNIADRALFFASASYKFNLQGRGLESIEPLFMFRGIQNYKNIFDAGVNMQFYDQKLFFNSIYHSTNSVTFGIGTLYKKQLNILVQYTTNTSDLQNYSNGEFEMALKYKF